jgi:hypothetical protein
MPDLNDEQLFSFRPVRKALTGIELLPMIHIGQVASEENQMSSGEQLYADRINPPV